MADKPSQSLLPSKGKYTVEGAEVSAEREPGGYSPHELSGVTKADAMDGWRKAQW